MSTVTTQPTLTASLKAQGFRPGAPPHVEKFGAVVDREVCAAGVCPECGAAGLGYEPWHRGRRYRVIMTCGCGYREEL